ncbi:hypothetical protein JCM3774_005392 [Rhodotorula dairenensis]
MPVLVMPSRTSPDEWPNPPLHPSPELEFTLASLDVEPGEVLERTHAETAQPADELGGAHNGESKSMSVGPNGADQPGRGAATEQAQILVDGRAEDGAVEASNVWQPRSDLHDSPPPPRAEPKQESASPPAQELGLAGRIRGLTPMSARQLPIALQTFCETRSDPPPPSRAPCEYMVALPFRSLGRFVIGSGGRTKRSICDSSRLVEMRILFTTDEKCFLHLFGTRAAIRDALARVRHVVYHEYWWQLNAWERGELTRRGSRWVEWSDRNAEMLQGAWLKEHYADVPRPAAPTFDARPPQTTQSCADGDRRRDRAGSPLRNAMFARNEASQSAPWPSLATFSPERSKDLGSRPPASPVVDRTDFRRPGQSNRMENDAVTRSRAGVPAPTPTPSTSRVDWAAAENASGLKRDGHRTDTPAKRFAPTERAASKSSSPPLQRPTTDLAVRKKRTPSSPKAYRGEQVQGVGGDSGPASAHSLRISIPDDAVMCFIGPKSCAPYIECVADTRLKIEILSGRAEIVLEGGDISKARQSVAEVLQKKQKETYDAEGRAQGKSASPDSEEHPRKRRVSRRSSIGSSRFCCEHSDRGEVYSTPDTSFGNKADQQFLTGAALEHKLRQAAYESAAKRRKTKHPEPDPGPPMLDRRTFERMQDWVADVRHSQNQREQGRRSSLDSRASSSQSSLDPRGSPIDKRSEDDFRRRRFEPMDDYRRRTDVPARPAPRADQQRSPEREEDWRRRGYGRGASDRWTKGNAWELRELAPNARGVGWGAKGWHQTYSYGRERGGVNR